MYRDSNLHARDTLYNFYTKSEVKQWDHQDNPDDSGILWYCAYNSLFDYPLLALEFDDGCAMAVSPMCWYSSTRQYASFTSSTTLINQSGYTENNTVTYHAVIHVNTDNPWWFCFYRARSGELVSTSGTSVSYVGYKSYTNVRILYGIK